MVQAARAGHYAIGGEEDGVIGMGECADPEECNKIADLSSGKRCCAALQKGRNYAKGICQGGTA